MSVFNLHFTAYFKTKTYLMKEFRRHLKTKMLITRAHKGEFTYKSEFNESLITQSLRFGK